MWEDIANFLVRCKSHMGKPNINLIEEKIWASIFYALNFMTSIWKIWCIFGTSKKTFLLFRLFNYCKIRCFSPRKFYVFCQLPSLSNIDFYDTVRILGLQNHDYNENMCKYQLNEPFSIKKTTEYKYKMNMHSKMINIIIPTNLHRD